MGVVELVARSVSWANRRWSSAASWRARSETDRFIEHPFEFLPVWAGGCDWSGRHARRRCGFGRIGEPSFWARRFWSIAWSSWRGSRAAVNDGRGEERVELVLAPGGVAGGEDDFDEHLLAPFATWASITARAPGTPGSGGASGRSGR